MKCNLQRVESLMMNILTLSLEPLIFNLKSELNKNIDWENEETKKYVNISLCFILKCIEIHFFSMSYLNILVTEKIIFLYVLS